ncbi:tRNA pseudouridine(55) synthase TruB [Spiroplasma endosymbiont of Aspidapion aeneum]|uniref:tRNA pseudouridine(55) synthase TruB n=1 Tax=Spiroplasma endosymbiont of Aspidapion aeneum TaxID=3066276 RepID=UPI00313ECC06
MISNSGVLLIDKEMGLTSHDVLVKLKKKFNLKKIGHAGTLDPIATGLLVVLINQATKISDFLLNEQKEYIFKMKFFLETDSLDISGKILKEEVPYKLSKKNVASVIEKFNGYIYEQEPPVFSAIKVKGKKLLNHVLDNTIETIEIKKRTVEIDKLELIKYYKKTNEIELRVLCSKGAYVRSLCRDIAFDLGTIATVSQLRRIKSGVFSINDAKTIADVKETDLISLYSTIEMNNYALLQYANERDIIHGKRIKLINIKEDLVFIINKNHDVLAIYERVVRDTYECKRGFIND